MATAGNGGFRVRLYRPGPGGDRDGIRAIFDLTGLFGDRVGKYFPAPGFITDAMVEYYLRFEPDWLLVAEDGATGRIAGYITGCPDTARRERLAIIWLLPRLLAGLFRYGLFHRSELWRMAFAGLRDQLAERLGGARGKPLDTETYPAHLHMAVHPEFHRRGIGVALLTGLCDRVAEAGIPGIHLHTTNLHQAAIAMYLKQGFRQHSVSRTTMFNHLLPREMLPVENIIMVKDLLPRTQP